jgi:hypothetical protein
MCFIEPQQGCRLTRLNPPCERFARFPLGATTLFEIPVVRHRILPKRQRVLRDVERESGLLLRRLLGRRDARAELRARSAFNAATSLRSFGRPAASLLRISSSMPMTGNGPGVNGTLKRPLQTSANVTPSI